MVQATPLSLHAHTNRMQDTGGLNVQPSVLAVPPPHPAHLQIEGVENESFPPDVHVGKVWGSLDV